MSYGTYEGREITDVGVIVRKTGDGLSESVEVDPTMVLDVRQGSTGYIVFAYQCVDVHYPVTDRKHPTEGGLKRVPVLDAGTATFLDSEIVAEAVGRQEERNAAWRAEQARLKAESKGQYEIEDVVLVDEHRAGEHADGLVEHCPLCDDERELAEEEAREDLEVAAS